MCSWHLLILIIHSASSIHIGSIANVSLTLELLSASIIMNGTKDDCLCEMMSSSNIAALNYFANNNTCKLFSKSSITNVSYWWTINVDGRFYFLTLPTRKQVILCATRKRFYLPSFHLPIKK